MLNAYNNPQGWLVSIDVKCAKRNRMQSSAHCLEGANATILCQPYRHNVLPLESRTPCGYNACWMTQGDCFHMGVGGAVCNVPSVSKRIEKTRSSAKNAAPDSSTRAPIVDMRCVHRPSSVMHVARRSRHLRSSLALLSQRHQQPPRQTNHHQNRPPPTPNAVSSR